MEHKILHRKIIHGADRSYSYSPDSPLTIPLHRHAEYELIYIISGTGQEFIGDAVQRYSAGDLILIGSDVPHLHLCDSVTDKTCTHHTKCDILQFPRNIFPESIADIKEYSFINSVLELSMCGVKFRSKDAVGAAMKHMRTITKKDGIERITTLLKTLDVLGRSQDITVVSPVKPSPAQLPGTAYEPVNKIYSYMQNNFSRDITLDGLAGYAQLNRTALCRCFKRSTGKTLFDCLSEIRVGHACKLLQHSNLTIAQIAYESGFNNLSHFNRQFRAVTAQTPSEYKKNLQAKI